MGNTLGNKGGVGITLKIGKTKFIFVNSHLAAGQNSVKQRNNDYYKISQKIPDLLVKNMTKTKSKLILKLANKMKSASPPPSPKKPSLNNENKNESKNENGNNNGNENGNNSGNNVNRDSSVGSNSPKITASRDSTNSRPTLDPADSNPGDSSKDPGEFDQCGDYVLFMGDMNYRIRGNRYVRACMNVSVRSMCILLFYYSSISMRDNGKSNVRHWSVFFISFYSALI